MGLRQVWLCGAGRRGVGLMVDSPDGGDPGRLPDRMHRTSRAGGAGEQGGNQCGRGDDAGRRNPCPAALARHPHQRVRDEAAM